MTKRFLCVGRVYADLVFRSDDLPRWGHEVFCDGFQTAAGGGAFITAAYLARLGHQVSIAGNAGADEPFATIIRQDLARCGIEDRHLMFSDGAQVTVAIAGASDRAFVTQTVQNPITAPCATGFDHLHIGELSTLLDCSGLIDLARREGASISADCGDQKTYPQHVQPLLEQLDVFLPNEREVQALETAGISLSNVPLVVEKQGLRGARANGISVPAVPADVVDTTGAGDAFAAGFLDAWINQQTLETALIQGTQMGAKAVSHMGGVCPET